MSMFEHVYERGIAVGESDIKNDAMVFRFRDEKFKFPAVKAHAIARYNGYWYEAPIDEVRRLEAEAASG